jgi:outer membrane protein assembly factor BamB
MRRIATLLIAFACLPAAADQWTTFGANPQRDSWSRGENILNKDNAGKIKLVWKLKIDSAAREETSLAAPVVVENVLTVQGHKDIILVAGASDTLDAIDADTGKVLWHKKFAVTAVPRQAARWLCPNAVNATPVIQSGGENPRDRTVHMIASDGKLHSLNVVNGEDRKPPADFVPPFSKNWSLSLVDGVLYTTTSQGCGGAKSGVWAMDLDDPKRPVAFFASTGGIWGRAGVAVGPKGTIFALTGDAAFDPAADKYGDSLLALTPKTLQLLDYYTPVNFAFMNRRDLDMGSISPMVLTYKQRDLVIAAGKEGRLFVLDAKSPGGATHREPLYRSPVYLNSDLYSAARGFWGAFASWEDAKGTRWVYAPGWGPIEPKSPAFPIANGPAPNGCVMAFRLEEKDGKPVLTPAWTSRDMNVPEPPIVANGVVFAVSNGENTLQATEEGRIMSTEQRLNSAPGHAILFAFDAESGKELYSSGDAISGIAHFSGIAISNGRVYVTTFDSTLYSFGFEEQ